MFGIQVFPSLNAQEPLEDDQSGRRSTMPPPFYVGGSLVHPNGLSTLFPENGEFPADWARRIKDLLDLADSQAYGTSIGEGSADRALSIEGISWENISDIRFSALISNQYFNIKRQNTTNDKKWR